MGTQNKILVGVFSVVVIIACVALVVFIRQRKGAEQSPTPANSQSAAISDLLIRRQLETTEQIEKERRPLTEEEIKKQLETAEVIRKEQENAKPLTQEEIDEQVRQMGEILRDGQDKQ